MEKSLVKIGNSMGFIIPKNYLKSLGNKVIIEMTADGLLIKPKKSKVLTLKELLASTDMDKLFIQMKKDADDIKTQEFYKSKEVQEFDNTNEIIDEY